MSLHLASQVENLQWTVEEVENFLDVDLLISNRLDSAVLGEGVDIQGSYAKGERPITSITLFSRHDTGATMSGYIDMTVYMSIAEIEAITTE